MGFISKEQHLAIADELNKGWYCTYLKIVAAS